MNREMMEKEIREITEKLAADLQPDKVMLFGSWAWGTPSEDSDLDLFVIKESRQTSLEMMREINRILFDRKIPVDILAYTPLQLEKRKELGDPFVAKILNFGKVLYERKR